jgi:cysteine desulfurase
MPAKLPVYLDNNATTRTDPRVVEAMLPYFSEDYGNPSSESHAFGWRAEEALLLAREQLVEVLGATSSDEILFTSGATESNNLALQGMAEGLVKRGDHLIAQETEHPSVLEVLQVLARKGRKVSLLPVDSHGLVDPQQLREALTPRTVLVSLMFANNEIGTLQPVAELARVCHEREVLFHCDAAQAVGKVPVNVEALGIDLLSFSAHKLYGPKGVGALVLRGQGRRTRLAPLMFGGSQERGLRPGTVPVALAVGLAKASQLCSAELDVESMRLRALTEKLLAIIQAGIAGVELNGHPTQRLPGTLNLLFPGLDSGKLLSGLPGFALSSGSACSSGSGKVSHVLTALGRSESQARASLRFGLGRFTTAEEVERVGEAVVQTARSLH